MSETKLPNSRTYAGHPMRAIRTLDYTIIWSTNLAAMRRFYTDIMRFEVYHEAAGGDWIEFRVGPNIFAISKPDLVIRDQPPAASGPIQLAFRVRAEEVDACEAFLRSEDVAIVSPAKDQPWGHRTMFFRDPDGHLIEIYADI